MLIAYASKKMSNSDDAYSFDNDSNSDDASAFVNDSWRNRPGLKVLIMRVSACFFILAPSPDTSLGQT